MSPLRLNHFQALLLFALVVSVGLGVLSRRSPKEQLKYTARSLFWFLLIGIGIAWVMYPFSR